MSEIVKIAQTRGLLDNTGKIIGLKNDRILERLLPAGRNDVMESGSAMVKFHVCSIGNTFKEMCSSI